jgi:hypothetical protein
MSIYQNKKKLYTIENKKKNSNMNVDEHLYNHFQSLTPAQQKAIQDLMLSKILKDFSS